MKKEFLTGWAVFAFSHTCIASATPLNADTTEQKPITQQKAIQMSLGVGGTVAMSSVRVMLESGVWEK